MMIVKLGYWMPFFILFVLTADHFIPFNVKDSRMMKKLAPFYKIPNKTAMNKRFNEKWYTSPNF